MFKLHRIEGYAIVSEDGMVANAAGIMPDSLKFEADKVFFERGLDGVDVVVHGRHSQEYQRHSDLRRRLILTRKVSAITVDPSNKKALFWNPAGCPFRKRYPEIDLDYSHVDLPDVASFSRPIVGSRSIQERGED
jgi:hypothetical protein